MTLPNYISDELFDEVEKNVRDYHNGPFTDINLKSLYWEKILNYSLNNQGHETTHRIGSHQVGGDIEINKIDKGRISCKSGAIRGTINNPTIAISSFRSATLKTLEEKISYFDSGHEDVVIALVSKGAKTAKTIRDRLNFDYLICVFSPLCFGSLKWKRKQTGTGWESRGHHIEADIWKTLSDQLWYYIPLNMIENIIEYKREIVL